MLGFLGVDVFFALSGFLITRILLQKKGQPGYYRNFYARRFLRLAPAYFLTIAIVAMIEPRGGAYLILSAVYIANFATFLHVPIGYGVLWSLCIEEQFYLLWPWLVGYLSERRLLLTCFLIALLTPIARVVAVLHGNFDGYLSWYRFDGLAWGAFAALWMGRRGAKGGLWRTVAITGSTVLLVGLFAYATGRKDLGQAILYRAVPMLTIVLIQQCCDARPTRLRRILQTPALRLLGDLSYWIYLIHYVFLHEVLAFLAWRYPELAARGGAGFLGIILVTVFACSILSGIAVRRWIELPALRLKSRFA